MPSVNEVLSQNPEEYPKWLDEAANLDAETLTRFFWSRVVYYPGSGSDGRALAVFGGTHSAHCFVHVDLTTTAQSVMQELQPEHPKHCNGYTPIYQTEFKPDDLIDLLKLDMDHPIDRQPDLQSGLWTILARDEDRSNEHGPERLALLHIQAEAVWVCWNLWSRFDQRPFAVILQDHGFGGNWAKFGGSDAPLLDVAEQTALPEYLLVAENTKVWPSFEAVTELSKRANGRPSKLYRRDIPNEEPQFEYVDVHDFEIFHRQDSLYELKLFDQPFLTFKGDPVCHRSRRLLRQMLDEFDGQGRITVQDQRIAEPHFNSSYTILCVQKTLIESGWFSETTFSEWLAGDPVLHPCAGPEYVDQLARWQPVSAYVADFGLELLRLPSFYDEPSRPRSDEANKALEASTPPEYFCRRLESEFEQLFPEEKAVVLHLREIHGGLFLLPMALVAGRCTPNEYALGSLAAHFGIVEAFSGVENEEHRASFEDLLSHANRALSYLRAAGIVELGIRYVYGRPIRSDETRICEFKEVKGRNPVDSIKNTADEYVVSFLNSDGGRIVWGVRDSDGVAVGVHLNYEQRENLRRNVVAKLNEIQPKIDPTQYRLSLHPVVDERAPIEDLYVVEIDVPNRDSDEPYYTGGNECFVRVDGSKKKLVGPALTDWIKAKLSSEDETSPSS